MCRSSPLCGPFVSSLKQFLYERGLASTYTGGLNSYCLVLMLVAYLQSRPHPYRYYRQHMQQVHERLQVPLTNEHSTQITFATTHHCRRTTRYTSSSAATSLSAYSARHQHPAQLAHKPPSLWAILASTCHSHDPSAYTMAQYGGVVQSGGVVEEGTCGALLGELQLSGLYAPLQSWEDDLGALLIGALEWYGEVFDFSSMGIAVAPPPTMPYLPSHLSPQLSHISMCDVTGRVPRAALLLSTVDGQQAADDSVPGCFYRLPAPSSLLVLSDPFYPRR